MIGQVSASADPADLLCAAYDRTGALTLRTAVERWDADAGVAALAAEVERAALAGTLDGRLDGDERALYAVVRGLDRALAHANPHAGAVPPPALATVALRYARRGRLDTGAAGGALLPRVVTGGRRGQLPESLADALGAVVRVPEADWAACDHAVLAPRARLSRADRESGLQIVTAPMVADPDELRWDVAERNGLRFYRIGPADREATLQRVRRVVEGFDAAGAAIGVAPELCLSPALLAAWREALAEPRDSALRLVLVGTGNVDGCAPPSNTAALLDGRTGEVVVLQRKIFPFNLTPADVELWGLDGRVPAPVDEDLTPGERVTVVEAGGVRLAILVCEDLARVPALAGPLCSHGISLLLVPVFARPTKDRRWERARAEAYSDATGATIVVANSLVVARIQGVDGAAGTAIAVGGGSAAVGTAAEPHDCASFRIGGGAPYLTNT